MRRRIAKQKRRECLRHGAIILSEGWLKWPEDGSKWYEANLYFNGWNIHAPGKDELEAYQGALFCVESSKDEPGNAVYIPKVTEKSGLYKKHIL